MVEQKTANVLPYMVYDIISESGIIRLLSKHTLQNYTGQYITLQNSS